MKKQYSVPQVEVEFIAIEENFVATADDLTKNSTYKDNYTESDFWD